MNIFRFIADMLHLTAILLLLYRIRKNRNCIGKSTPQSPNPCRSLLQDPRTILARVLHPLCGPLHVLHLPLQHLHEDLLHLLNSPHHLPDALQEALLHCTLSAFSFLCRHMTS